MRYLGGKSRTAKQIAGYIHNVIQPEQAYYEPFCGACWVTCEIHAPRRYASDANAGMIALWQALQDGWIPPDAVSEDEYAAAKAGDYADRPHLEAFILVGCSFGGKWGAGYAGRFERNYALNAINSLLAKMGVLYDVQFTAHDYRDLQPEPYSLIYCDPPYEGTAGYDAVGAFDSTAFWRWAQQMTSNGHTVVVSEYAAPAGWSCVVEMPTTTDMRTADNGRENRTERLFRYGDHAPLQPRLPIFDMETA